MRKRLDETGLLPQKEQVNSPTSKKLPSGDVPTRMALHANGVLAVYCQRDLSLYALTLNAKVLSKVELGERISHLSFTHEGEHLVLGGEKGTLSVRDAYSLDQCH